MITESQQARIAKLLAEDDGIATKELTEDLTEIALGMAEWGATRSETPGFIRFMRAFIPRALHAIDVRQNMIGSAIETIEGLHPLAQAARDCGTSPDNPGTCGVCGKHFAGCETACPGARVRVALIGVPR